MGDAPKELPDSLIKSDRACLRQRTPEEMEETREAERAREMFAAYESGGLEGIKSVLRKRDEEYQNQLVADYDRIMSKEIPMPPPMTPQEYAQTLIEHFSSIAAAAPELNLRKIFSGARKAIPTWLDPDEDRIVREGYAIAERELFQEHPE
jgi:hypothetical protein